MNSWKRREEEERENGLCGFFIFWLKGEGRLPVAGCVREEKDDDGVFFCHFHFFKGRTGGKKSQMSPGGRLKDHATKEHPPPKKR